MPARLSCTRCLSCVFTPVAYLGGARSSNSEGAGTRRRPPAREHCTGLLADHAYYTAALQPVAYLGGARRRNSERVGTCVLGGILGCPERFGLLVFHNAKNAGLGHTYPRASRIDHTRSTVIMPQPCDSWAEPAQDFAEHKQPQGRRTLARSTFLMWRILNSEYTSTWRWALLKTDDALLMHVLQFAVLLFCPKTKQCYDHGDIKLSRLKRFLEQPQAVSLLHVASGFRKNRCQRCQ